MHSSASSLPSHFFKKNYALLSMEFSRSAFWPLFFSGRWGGEGWEKSERGILHPTVNLFVQNNTNLHNLHLCHEFEQVLILQENLHFQSEDGS